MKLLGAEELAALLLYADCIDDILLNYDFRYDMKHEFNKITKSVRKITKKAFGDTDMDEFDDFKQQIHDFVSNLVKDKAHLKEP